MPAALARVSEVSSRLNWLAAVAAMVRLPTDPLAMPSLKVASRGGLPSVAVVPPMFA